MARMWLFWMGIFSMVCSLLMCQGLPTTTTISAVLRRDVILPCAYQIASPYSSKDYRIYWQIPGRMQNETLVYFLNFDRVEALAEQSSAYDNRAKLFLGHLDEGNFSLLLSDVNLRDQASYECVIVSRDVGKSTKSIIIELQVSAPYNEPTIGSSELCSGQARTHTCNATGGYPKPLIYWTVNDEPIPNDLYNVTTESFQDPIDQTYSVTSKMTMQGSEHALIGCTVENQQLGQNKSASVKNCQRSGSQALSVSAASVFLLEVWLVWKV
ncbi:ICOS ligand-like [Ambystoma mexicanum]|uniref:ICOS ligand-like n=1 Tax=Ambystoma mexicanum TaxID=8296 RepID=UPI0037E7D4C9